MPRREFGAVAVKAPDPPEFTLEGRVFRCAPEINVEALAAIVTAPNLLPEDHPEYSESAVGLLGAIVDFLLASVDDKEALAEILGTDLFASSEHGIGVIVDIFTWLLSEYGSGTTAAATDPEALETTSLDGILDLVMAGVGDIGEQDDG